jgi:hypothetical protein
MAPIKASEHHPSLEPLESTEDRLIARARQLHADKRSPLK